MENEAGKRLAADPNKGKKIAALIAVGVIVILLAAYLVLCAMVGGDTLPPNSRAVGVDLSGMTRSQAEEAISDRLTQMTKGKKLALYEPGSGVRVELDVTGLVAQGTLETGVGGNSFLARGASYLGGLLSRGKDLPVGIYFSEAGNAKVDAALSEISRKAGASGQPTTYEVTEEAILFTKGITGTSVDMEAFRNGLRSAITGEGPDQITIAFIETPPEEPDIEAIQEKIYAVASEAYFDPEVKEIIPSVTGKDFDVEAARIALAGTADGGLCRVPLQLDVPQMTTEQLTGLLFRDVLGEAVTRVTGTSDRIMNVGVAADFVNGTILMPGEEFSFNKVCSPYTVDNGYGKATAYVNGLSKDTVAGGICQASSTLYWASLKANLETVERYAHRYEPAYVNGGLDATVYGDYEEEGSLDFRFTNSTDHPIKIEGYMDDKRYLHMAIYGTDTTGIHGEPYSTNRVVTQPYQTLYEANDTVPQGTTRKDSERTGYNGVSWETYQKLVDAEGNTISTTLLYKTKYYVRNEVLLYNPADAEMWGIDPATGIRTEPVVAPVESEPPVTETPAPSEPVVEPPVSTQPGDVVLPPDGGQILPPEGSGQAPESEPPAQQETPPTQDPAPSQEPAPTPGGDLFLPPQV